MTDLTRLEAAAAGLESLPEMEDTADYLGRLDKIIRTLQGHRRMVMSEVSGPLTGKAYRIVEGRDYKRTYNTRLLREDFLREGVTLDGLIDADVVRLVWQWTSLRTLARSVDLQLKIGGHELDGGDESDHVGETWTLKHGVEAVDFERR